MSSAVKLLHFIAINQEVLPKVSIQQKKTIHHAKLATCGLMTIVHQDFNPKQECLSKMSKYVQISDPTMGQKFREICKNLPSFSQPSHRQEGGNDSISWKRTHGVRRIRSEPNTLDRGDRHKRDKGATYPSPKISQTSGHSTQDRNQNEPLPKNSLSLYPERHPPGRGSGDMKKERILGSQGTRESAVLPDHRQPQQNPAED